MLTLFHAPQSRSGRIVWLLEEIGADYDIRYVDIFRSMTLTGARDPANLHPDGKVPALLHDEGVVTESAAIALYLTDLHPEAKLGAGVGAPDRGVYVTWLAWTAGEMEPAFWGKISGAAETDPNAASRYDEVIARLLTALATGPYLMGARFTAVDVMIASALAWGREYVPESALVDSYLERVLTRPANARAAAKDGALPASVQAA